MAWSAHAKGANSAMNAETRRQNLEAYLKNHTVNDFNIVECYNLVFAKQNYSDKLDMKSISTLNKYIKDYVKQHGNVITPTIDRALSESGELMKRRAKRVAEDKVARDAYKERYGVIIGDRALE